MQNNVAILALFMATTASAQITPPTQSQRSVEMTSQYGAPDIDLQSILYFEDIGLEKIKFVGEQLNGRDYIISIEDYVNGTLSTKKTVFDSREDSYFRIRGNELPFRVLSKAYPGKSAKLEFQFSGFAKRVDYYLLPNEGEFALKSFLGSQPSMPVDLSTENVVLTYMMPYVKEDGSKQYCDVVQSSVVPEQLGKKYKIPRYFLIKIKFFPAAA